MATYLGNKEYYDIRLGTQPIYNIQQPKADIIAEYLVIASGHNGGITSVSPNSGGGGGAGGLLSGSLTIKPYQNYFIQVGWNDANNIAYDSYITGSNFYIYATAGGKGGEGNGSDTQKNGGNGGSGGGGGRNANGSGTGGTGISGQGFAGGNSGTTLGGGGGGAGGAGKTGGAPDFGAGGVGKTSSITGTAITYSKGGDGGQGNTGGGDGVNYGDGGGGQRGDQVGSRGRGKQGVVILRYPGPQQFSGGTVTTDGIFTIHTFTTTDETLGAAYTRYSIINR